MKILMTKEPRIYIHVVYFTVEFPSSLVSFLCSVYTCEGLEELAKVVEATSATALAVAVFLILPNLH